MKDKYTFVVVGGGIAGVSCIEALNVWQPGASILLISETPSIKMATNAVNISKTLVQFDVEEKSADCLKDVDVAIDKVTEINSSTNSVVTFSGQAFQYECICLCNGGKPKLIAKNSPFILGVRDTDSVKHLRDRLAKTRRVVIVGNGGIASELIYEMKGVEKVWVIKDQHVNSVFLDPGAAHFFSKSMQSKQKVVGLTTKRCRYVGDNSGAALGPDWATHFTLAGASKGNNVVIIQGASVVEVTQEHKPEEYQLNVLLDTGQVVKADLVVSATGVEPNGTDVSVVPKALNIASDGGILVDENMRTNIPGIYAAGDVATAGWDASRHWLQMRLWTQARQSGLHAGKAMAAQLTNESIYSDFSFEIFSHVTQFFGHRVILLGLFNGQKLEGEVEYLVRMTEGSEYVKVILQNGKVQGAVLIGDTELEEMCENLILDQLDVSFLGDQVLDPNVDVDDYFD